MNEFSPDEHGESGREPKRASTTYIREIPAASSGWLHAGLVFLTTALGVLISGLTLGSESRVTVSSLLVLAAAFMFAMGSLCLLAQWDSNRGRRAKAFEIHKR